MDKKISELNELENVIGSEYLVVASNKNSTSYKNYKVKLDNVKDKPIQIDAALSEISKNPVQNKTITLKLNELEQGINRNSNLINNKKFWIWTDNTTTATLDSEQNAEVRIRDLGYDENNIQKLAFSFAIPRGLKGDKGDIGPGINIKGSFDSEEALIAAWNAGELDPIQVGDSYLINGDLYVFDRNGFLNAGNVQGPPGASNYIHQKYADMLDAYGVGVFTEGNGETPGKYVGYLINDDPIDSDNPSDYTWSQFRGNDGFGYEYIFKRTTTFEAPEVPTEITGSDVAPTGWTDDPTGVDEDTKYEWCCYRKSDENGVWSQWRGKSGNKTHAWLFTMYTEAISIKGDTGNPGPIVYPAGEWQSDIYNQTKNNDGVITASPYVYHEGDYYVLITETTSEEPGTGKDWQLMEKFNVLYADILLADKANVGKACFYGNYIFSRGGSGDFEHYDFTKTPYATDQPFKPAWCVDLITGEMWAGTGTSYFAADGSGYLSDGKINWNTDGKLFLPKQGKITASFKNVVDRLDNVLSYNIEVNGTYTDTANVKIVATANKDDINNALNIINYGEQNIPYVVNDKTMTIDENVNYVSLLNNYGSSDVPKYEILHTQELDKGSIVKIYVQNDVQSDVACHINPIGTSYPKVVDITGSSNIPADDTTVQVLATMEQYVDYNIYIKVLDAYVGSTAKVRLFAMGDCVLMTGGSYIAGGEQVEETITKGNAMISQYTLRSYANPASNNNNEAYLIIAEVL